MVDKLGEWAVTEHLKNKNLLNKMIISGIFP